MDKKKSEAFINNAIKLSDDELSSEISRLKNKLGMTPTTLPTMDSFIDSKLCDRNDQSGWYYRDDTLKSMLTEWEQITSAPLLKRIEIVEEDRLRYQNIADSLKEEVKKQWPLLAKIKELEELFEKSFTLAEIRRKEIDKLILELDPLQSEIESLKKEVIELNKEIELSHNKGEINP
jgi:chromosome segregation ATPase